MRGSGPVTRRAARAVPRLHPAGDVERVDTPPIAMPSGVQAARSVAGFALDAVGEIE
jgi:hypothetical protein